jgi:hypothetical protein
MRAPFGYCPTCGKSGIKETGGVVECSAGHSYNLFEADLGDDPEPEENPTWTSAEKKAPVIVKNEKVKIPEVKLKPKEPDLIQLAQNIQKSNQKIERGFEVIHKKLEALLIEVEQYLPKK